MIGQGAIGVLVAGTVTATISAGNKLVITDTAGTQTLSLDPTHNYFDSVAVVKASQDGTNSLISLGSAAPVSSSPTLTVAENAGATPIGIATPTDPNFTASQLTYTAGLLPTDGVVTLADGTTAVTTGEVLTLAQLTGLEFTPTANAFHASSTFTYSATDPLNNRSLGTATLAIGPAVGNPVHLAGVPDGFAENAAATTIDFTAPSDPNDAVGSSKLQDRSAAHRRERDARGRHHQGDRQSGPDARRSSPASNSKKRAAGAFRRQFDELTYTVFDPDNNTASGSATLAVGPAVGNPVVSSPTLTVAANGAATAIGIAAPSDPNFAAAQLTIALGTLPTDGTVTLADGTTLVTAGEVLTPAQLTGLKFTPAANVFNGSSTLTYTVTDPDHNASTGTATLKTGSVAPSAFAASLTAAENSAATPIGIAAPTDPVYPVSQLTVTVGTLPTDGTVTLADGVTTVTAGELLTVAQLTGLEFTPARALSRPARASAIR